MKIQEGKVLIESDWNLKEEGSVRTCQINMVLIESDWNLKFTQRSNRLSKNICINRIILEFKDYLII